MKLRELKIKIKNLADEARTIREEERKTSGMERWHLQHHRKTVVRSAARANLLAYACLRGMPYCRVEPRVGEYFNRWNRPEVWRRVEKTVLTFGGTEEMFKEWQEAADAYIDSQMESREAA